MATFYNADLVGLLLLALAIVPMTRVIATRRLRRAAGRETAQALLEFALLAPIMFVLLFSIVDFGIAIDRRVALQHAVREGARYGAVHSICPDVVNRTIEQAQEMEDLTVDVSYVDKDGNGNPGDVGDAVHVKGTFEWKFPIVGELGSALGMTSLTVPMEPSGTARLEHSVTDTTGCTGSS